MKLILALCAVITGTAFLKHLIKIKEMKKQSLISEHQKKQMDEYFKLAATPNWVEIHIHPVTNEAYERLWQELKKDHEQGKHKVHHYIDCISCRKEYNNENENS